MSPLQSNHELAPGLKFRGNIARKRDERTVSLTAVDVQQLAVEMEKPRSSGASSQSGRCCSTDALIESQPSISAAMRCFLEVFRSANYQRDEGRCRPVHGSA